jgi:hypothetical protein
MRPVLLIPGLFAIILAACSGQDGGGGGDGGDGDDDGGGTDVPGVDSGSTGTDPDPVAPDPCADQAPVCPSEAGVDEGSGLAAIDRCAFPMEDQDTWDDRGAIIDQLAADLDAVTVADVLGDLNRIAEPITPAQLPGDVSGVTSAFGWQSGDQSVPYWIPQGITGSGDGVEGPIAGRRVLLVSWYYNRDEDPGSPAEKGVRIALVDATDPDDIRYRFLLLVEPTMDGDRPTFGPITIHAGGLAWVGDYLYVVDTSRGLRAFDLSRILRVQTGVDTIGHDPDSGNYYAHNYAYAIPQIGTYAQTSECAPRFSFISVDHSTAPRSLITGEYDADSVYGRLYRWPLDPETGRLREVGQANRVIPEAAWFSSHSHIQGALANDDTFLLSSSKPTGAAGILYQTAENTPSIDRGWSDTPEDLSLDPTDNQLWSLSEGLNARYVFSLPLD